MLQFPSSITSKSHSSDQLETTLLCFVSSCGYTKLLDDLFTVNFGWIFWVAEFFFITSDLDLEQTYRDFTNLHQYQDSMIIKKINRISK